MTHTTLQGALEALYGLERRRDKLGLDGTRTLLAALGNPERRFRAVHVAGTNGKGSTCALVERVLRSAGVCTGLFTSPHLVDFRERIRVNGRMAGEPQLFEALRRIEALPEAVGRTFFEIVTALGFAHFADSGVEWAVVETGLGGRLDTTNVLVPSVCAITRIGLDHTEILGTTMESIAREKAGIIKPGVPVVVAPDVGPPARAVIAQVARERGARMIEAMPEDAAASAGAPGGRVAAYQAANAATARAVVAVIADAGVAIPENAVVEGFRLARWPGRFEVAPLEPRLVWDGAHNADGMAALAHAWHAAGIPPPRAMVLAVSRDKDLAALLAILHGWAPEVTVFATRTASERALEPEQIASAARDAGFGARTLATVAAASRAALEAVGPDGLVVVTGSLFAVGEAMQAFGGAPGEVL